MSTLQNKSNFEIRKLISGNNDKQFLKEMSFLTLEDISVFENPNTPVKSVRVVGESRQ